ncbi:MAG: hydantoinase/oxoprolinase family protein [Alphaproteobacteria bacterium]|nr:hydantoinase/oxoprolinase family protein [Alphaproteobacteria bacterium]
MTKQGSQVEIGIDTGGTFTDVACRDAGGAVRRTKIPSTPKDPAEAILAALAHARDAWGIAPGAIRRFVHGTTVATNAVLERKGARTALLTTEGFRDVLEIGRHNRKDEELYQVKLSPNTPVFLAPARRRIGIRERIGADGSVVTPLDEAGLLRAVDALAAEGVEAIAIAFLFSFLNPVHEERAAALIAARHPGIALSLSSVVDPQFREYERTAVTAFDGYVKPVLARYLARTDARLRAAGLGCGFSVIHSRGGVTGTETAALRPVRLFLSGPAGGVIGGQSVAAAAGLDAAITLDIGGTSSDIALIARGKPLIASHGWIDGFAVRVPMVDVNSIGAGGGSIAWLDRAGGLHVGPRSAGADPGPACYGKGGEEPTVTDASLVLGYLDPDGFAGGRIRLDAGRAHRAIETRIARPMGLSVAEAALGIHRVVNAQMAEGIRFVSIKRGHDPRRFALVPLGGGGGLHATPLARALGLARVVVPQAPGVLSALGLLAAPIEHERATGFPARLADAPLDALRAAFARLDAECARLMAADGAEGLQRTVTHLADICYVGQSHHLEVAVDLAAADPRAALYAAFLDAHRQVYGHAVERPARIVNLRCVHQARAGGDAALSFPNDAPPRPSASRPIIVEGRTAPLPAVIIDRASLGPGTSIAGPAIIEQSDTTTLVEPGWRASVGEGGLLFLDRDTEARP